jgi:maltooligosyltrehalose trehalohydrolase
VEKGRKEFMTQFPSIAVDKLAPPHDPATFQRCKLDHSEREKHADAVAFHRELLRLRRPTDRVDGEVLSEHAFFLRLDSDRLLIINLGPAFELDNAPEGQWKALWSSEAVSLWRIPAEAAVLLEAVRYTRS